MHGGLLHIFISGSFRVSTTLIFYVACLFTLMKYVAVSPKVLVHFYQTARCHHTPSSDFCFYWSALLKLVRSDSSHEKSLYKTGLTLISLTMWVSRSGPTEYNAGSPDLICVGSYIRYWAKESMYQRKPGTQGNYQGSGWRCTCGYFHIYLISWPLYATLRMHMWIPSVAKWLKYTVEIELRKVIAALESWDLTVCM